MLAANPPPVLRASCTRSRVPQLLALHPFLAAIAPLHRTPPHIRSSRASATLNPILASCEHTSRTTRPRIFATSLLAPSLALSFLGPQTRTE